MASSILAVVRPLRPRRLQVQTALGAAVVALTLFATVAPAWAVSPPAQPSTGYGSTERYISTGATERSAGSELSGTKVWWYVPNTLRDGSSAPVVVLLHGFALLAPDIYQGHIDHLTRQGYIVVYPQINLAFPGLLFDSDQNAMMSRAIASTNTALGQLGSTAGALHLYGHSLGGLLAASWAGSGGPAVESVTLANASTGAGSPFGGTAINWQARGASNTARTVLLTGNADTIAPSSQSVDLFNAMPNASSRIVYQARSDTSGSPDLDADHMSPIQDDGIIPSWMMDFLGGDGEQDAMDFRFYYAALDAQLDGQRTVPFAMGTWSDGRPVLEPTVLASDIPPPPTGTVSGTMRETGSATTLADQWIAVLRTSDFKVVGGATTGAGGTYAASVPPGDYYLYLIDPSGGHDPAFHGAPATVTVTGGATTTVDPVAAPTRGVVGGTVSGTPGGAPVGGAWVLTMSATTGAPRTASTANGAGVFAVGGLAPGNHLLLALDPAGGHSPRYFPNSPAVPGASPVAVAAGGSTVADLALPAQTTPTGGAALTGTVTEQGSGTPIAGVQVLALHAASYQFAKAGTTNGSGNYSIDVNPGAYRLMFIDPTASHAAEWHDNRQFDGIASAASVTAPAVTNAALDPTTGGFGGTVTDQPSGTPLAGVWVLAIGRTGIAGGTATAGNGTYSVAGLPSGQYGALFIDPTGTRALEYWDNSPTNAGATTFAVTAGATATANAALAP